MRATSRAHFERAAIAAITTVGVFILLFPTIANWFSSLGFEEQRGSYEEAAEELTPEERAAIIGAAREYNATLPSGPLRDPYMIEDDGTLADMRDDLPLYNSQLDFGDGLLGWVEIPGIRTTLPIYHGTEDATLDKGAGHLHGSALPVGGDSSHAVVTAHSGRANASLFTELDKLRIGDVFFTQIVGEKFYYEVDQIDIVDPIYSGEKLRQVAGQDYVTLLTCTPTGVNSHRLLVRGVRIDAPEAEEALSDLRAVDYVADFPWWIPTVIVVPLAVWMLLGITDRRRRRSDHDPSATPTTPAEHAPDTRAALRRRARTHARTKNRGIRA